MYRRKFITESGSAFSFDINNNIIFDIEGLSGIDVNQVTSQGANQIGTALSQESVGEKYLTITGKIFGNESIIARQKRAMSSIFAPFTMGRLEINDKYFINCSVASTPTYTPNKKKGDFVMRLMCPYPFFKDVNTQHIAFGESVKLFSLPRNTDDPIKFSEKGASRYITAVNEGDVESDFDLWITAEGNSPNPRITNINTLEFLKINRTIKANEQVHIYRDVNGILRCNLLDINGTESSIIKDLDDDTNLTSLHRGDNVLLATDDEGGANLTAIIEYNYAYTGVYDE